MTADHTTGSVAVCKERIMFFLLYRHTDDGVFDDFPRISDQSPKIFQNLSEGHTNVSEHFPKIAKETNLISVKSSISSLVRIWKICHSIPGCCFVRILRVVYLQVNALSERIIRIYLHEFTNIERENSIPHEAAECGIENFEFIVSERVQVNPDNSRAMSALTFLLFKLNTLQTKIVKFDSAEAMV